MDQYQKFSEMVEHLASVVKVPGIVSDGHGGYNNVVTDDRYLLTKDEVDNIIAEIASKAPMDEPAFSGKVTVSDDLYVNGNLHVDTDAHFLQDVKVKQTLTSDNIVVLSNLDAEGITVEGLAEIDTLNVNGAATFNGTVLALTPDGTNELALATVEYVHAHAGSGSNTNPDLTDLTTKVNEIDAEIIDARDGHDSLLARLDDIQTTPGPKGEQGDQGIQGPKGDKGDQGIQGPTGKKGDKGDDGTSFRLIGSVATQGDLPVTADLGDCYKTDDDVHLHVWDGSAWQDLGSFQGIKGDKGDQGDAGAQGIQGEKGDKGDTGLKGDQGDAGATGATGPRGPQGVQGFTPYIQDGHWYINGINTNTPATGPKGEDGTHGTDGEDGETPYIKDGNWWIGSTDTGVAASGGGGTDAALTTRVEVLENGLIFDKTPPVVHPPVSTQTLMIVVEQDQFASSSDNYDINLYNVLITTADGYEFDYDANSAEVNTKVVDAHGYLWGYNNSMLETEQLALENSDIRRLMGRDATAWNSYSGVNKKRGTVMVFHFDQAYDISKVSFQVKHHNEASMVMKVKLYHSDVWNSGFSTDDVLNWMKHDVISFPNYDNTSPTKFNISKLQYFDHDETNDPTIKTIWDEVKDARGGAATLGERIDSIHAEINEPVVDMKIRYWNGNSEFTVTDDMLGYRWLINEGALITLDAPDVEHDVKIGFYVYTGSSTGSVIDSNGYADFDKIPVVPGTWVELQWSHEDDWWYQTSFDSSQFVWSEFHLQPDTIDEIDESHLGTVVWVYGHNENSQIGLPYTNRSTQLAIANADSVNLTVTTPYKNFVVKPEEIVTFMGHAGNWAPTGYFSEQLMNLASTGAFEPVAHEDDDTGSKHIELIRNGTVKSTQKMTEVWLELPADAQWYDIFTYIFHADAIHLPDSVEWHDGNNPVLEPTQWYELSIRNGIAVISGMTAQFVSIDDLNTGLADKVDTQAFDDLADTVMAHTTELDAVGALLYGYIPLFDLIVDELIDIRASQNPSRPFVTWVFSGERDGVVLYDTDRIPPGSIGVNYHLDNVGIHQNNSVDQQGTGWKQYIVNGNTHTMIGIDMDQVTGYNEAISGGMKSKVFDYWFLKHVSYTA